MRDAGSGFNPHTHAGCDSAARPKVLTVARFQSTHPRRVWPHRGHTASSAVCFNPHTHAGCDYYQCFDLHIRMFQSTHPRRVWPWSIFYNTRVIGFNPHTHAGCDIYDRAHSAIAEGFNPHTHAGCDLDVGVLFSFRNSFNPHTHAGCDTWFNSFNVRSLCFNPHTHAGCDERQAVLEQLASEFQSTHPRRVWLPLPVMPLVLLRSFNPHTHAGCDFCPSFFFWLKFVSIHTPTQGVTEQPFGLNSPC